MRHLVPLFLLTLPATALDIGWSTGLLQLDDQGRVTALLDRATGRNVAAPGRPLCRVQTDRGWLEPESVALAGELLTMRFAGGVTLVWRVRAPGRPLPGSSWSASTAAPPSKRSGWPN